MPKVLLVDDEPDVLDAMRLALGRLPVQVITAGDGRDALPLIADADVIVTDHRMPHMSGLTLLRHARVREPDVPRILVTAYADVDLASAAANDAHVHRFLRKPFDARELQEAVADALQSRLVRMRARTAQMRAT